ncbi:primosomal protein N' [Rudaeicoccus suwonensis]|uniref:Probable replication restart protein PriA n=1 Tax=Rudaeicoccus suwonensis TaxID=657409 RepID=A0A561EA98_9MICO|nr:primosomal protein N' [Rudaeicoccus suwonensis]TWE12536.1 replication restart DNA helicase PriA [Rudaeicoccus suwonensis]
MTQELPHSANAEQLQLLHTAVSRPAPATPSGPPPGPAQPVARVVLDVGLAHLDRPFEYSVPHELDETAQPGVRVKVRFAGKDVSGYVVARVDEAEHAGKLTPLRRVVSPEPVLTPAVLTAARQVADHYAGVLSDVLRLAVPPRHAAAERALDAHTGPEWQPPEPTVNGAWQRYSAGPAFLARLAAGGGPAASWVAAPTTDPAVDWPAALAQAAASTLSAGRGVLIVVPDHRDLDRVEAALREHLGPDQHVRLTAEQGPQARYTAWLKVLRGHVRCVVGTRAAAWAPVRDLGLVAWWDDGDDLHCEPRSPYPHVREVLRCRARIESAALLVGGFARTVTVQQWVDGGWVQTVQRAVRRGEVPQVLVTGDEVDVERFGAAAHAHLPPAAWTAAHEALRSGPVLVQVPRRGYLPTLRCGTCRAPARCGECHGPLGLSAPQAPPVCRWCGRAAARWTCDECGQTRLRASVVGARRTAEELGRAFPGVPVVRSGAGEIVASVDASPALVIATPGAEPVASQGYCATLLLDAWALLDRPSLDAGEEAVRRWLAGAALTRDADAGGRVVLCGVAPGAPQPAVQALVRWSPVWFAERESRERVELRLPPAEFVAVVGGTIGDVTAFADAVDLDLADDGPVERLGPLQGDTTDTARLLLRAPLRQGSRLARAIAVARAGRSARKLPGTLSVRVDPSGALL